ncbi:MAG TPA: hypothetical protein VKE22_03225 [Haliangiales bacterium]|nr:hypothetical protein [Haliangiales bacterium]
MSKDEKDPRLFDTRVVERNIQKGLVTRKDYEKFLKALADLRDKTRGAGEGGAPGHGGDPNDEDDEDDEAGDD